MSVFNISTRSMALKLKLKTSFIQKLFCNFASGKVTVDAVANFKPKCTQLKCAQLGREIDCRTYEKLTEEFREEEQINLAGKNFDKLTQLGLDEIIALLLPHASAPEKQSHVVLIIIYKPYFTRDSPLLPL